MAATLCQFKCLFDESGHAPVAQADSPPCRLLLRPFECMPSGSEKRKSRGECGTTNLPTKTASSIEL